MPFIGGLCFLPGMGAMRHGMQMGTTTCLSDTCSKLHRLASELHRCEPPAA